MNVLRILKVGTLSIHTSIVTITKIEIYAS
jgi:hypothetical protein